MDWLLLDDCRHTFGTFHSGATIIGALMIGVLRTATVEFTFIMAISVMLGTSLFKRVQFG